MIAVDVSAELLRAADAVFDRREAVTSGVLARMLLDTVSPNWIVDLDNIERFIIVELVTIAEVMRMKLYAGTPSQRAWIVRVAIAAKKSPDMRAAFFATQAGAGLFSAASLRVIETFVPYEGDDAV